MIPDSTTDTVGMYDPFDGTYLGDVIPDLGYFSTPINAVLESAVSRLRPVAMAAATTILGMVPLFPDAFFVSMAVTIAFGLGFATILTMVVVPVLYSAFYKVCTE